MGLFSLFKNEKRSESKKDIKDKLWALFSPNARDVQTPYVNESLAQTISAFYCGMTQLCSGVAKLPLHVFEEVDGEKKRDRNHPIAKALHRDPNPFMTPFELKEMMTAHLILRGDFISQLYLRNNGDIWIIPLHPDRVEVTQNKNFGLVYHYTDSKGKMTLPFWQVMHVKGQFSNGLRGQSILSNARASLGRIVAMEDYASAHFAGSSIPSGILTYDGELEDSQIDQLKDQWKRQMENRKAEDRVAVLDETLKWQQIGISMEDSQFLESRVFEIQEISRWLNVPPHKLKELSHATFSNIEQQKLEFDQDSLLPLTKRIQESITKSVFKDDEKNRWVEFQFDSLLSTDVNTRYNAHNTALNGAWKTRNEVRAVENLPPLPGLDEILVPLNMSSGSKDEESPDSEEEGERDWMEPFEPVLRSIFERILTRESKLILSLRNKKDPISERNAAVERENSFRVKQLTPLLEGILRYEVPNSRGSVLHFLPNIVSKMDEEIRNMLSIGIEQQGESAFKTVSEGITSPDYLQRCTEQFKGEFKSYFYVKVAK